MKTSSDRVVVPAAALFSLAFALRLGLVLATDDRVGLHSPLFKGDAPLWLAYAQSLREGVPFAAELGLPFRPPATAWLLALVWDGTAEGLQVVRVTWLSLSALLAPLTFLCARSCGRVASLVAGGLVALSGTAIQLGSTVTSEVPCAVLVLLAIMATLRLMVRPSVVLAFAIGGLHALAALFRAEQVLLSLILVAWFALAARAAHGRALRAELIAMASGLMAVLAPWQVTVHARLAAFNAEVHPPMPVASLSWDPQARARLDMVPGFARASTARFIEATLRHRGRTVVGTADLQVVDDAFGVWPQALSTWPLIAIYGPLNFALANHEGAGGGFDRIRLDQAPPLTGGAEAFDPQWLNSLPRDGDLALEYPPHVALVRDGYAIGSGWLVSHPLDALTLLARKFWITWSGVAGGLGASQFPLGASGTRARVDLTVAGGAWATTWRSIILCLFLVGVSVVRGSAAIRPFLSWVAATFLVSLAFFGYARTGAFLVPPVAVFLGVLVQDRWNRRLWPWVLGSVLGVVAMIDLARVVTPPSFVVDGITVHRFEPFPPLEHRIRRVEVR